MMVVFLLYTENEEVQKNLKRKLRLIFLLGNSKKIKTLRFVFGGL